VFFGTMPNAGDTSSTAAAAAATNNSNGSNGSGNSIVTDQQQAGATGADATAALQASLSMVMLQACFKASTTCAFSGGVRCCLKHTVLTKRIVAAALAVR
jgi:hypothetical protein